MEEIEQYILPGIPLTPQEEVARMSLKERVERACELLDLHEPDEGYYLAFSGGKDSCVIKRLAEMADVKFEARYNSTTIDPPELIRFIKRHHADVEWNLPKHGNMMHRVATAPKVPPTRNGRWCCEEYKEHGGNKRVKIMGVRAAESVARKRRWSEVAEDLNKDRVICPIVHWSDAQLWEFIRAYEVPYCELYDQGWTRLGCVGCPLATRENQDREFATWPAFERNWKKAVIKNWEKWHDKPNTKTGNPRYQAKFSSGEAFWAWWRKYKAPDVIRGDCQSGLLWTNEELEEIE